MSETLSSQSTSNAPEYASLQEYQADVSSESFVRLAETIVTSPNEETISEALEDWKQNPGEHIKNQFEELNKVYRDRSDRETYHWHSSIEEVTSFATRDAAEENIEETYQVIDLYSRSNKEWKSRSYAVTMHHLDNGGSTTLIKDFDNNIRVVGIDSEGQAKDLHGEDKEDAMIDFFSRSVVAWDKNRQRTPEEKAAAAADAHMKLEKRLYGGPKPAATSLE